MSLRALMQRPMARRILASTGSNAYAQATTIAMQLLSLPLFLTQWGMDTYGRWLILSAIPAALVMADAGMVSAAGNRMTMFVADGRKELANRAFQSAMLFLIAITAVLMPLVLVAVLAWPAESIQTVEMRLTIVVLAVTVFVTLFGGLPEAVYRATERNALGAALANTTRLLEWLGGLAGLWLVGSFLAVACGALLARTICTVGLALHATRRTPDFRWGWADASTAEMRVCARPALSFMAFPIANALNHQGMTLVCAAVLGPAATVVFNTYRTLARVTVQATGVFSTAVWPEFSRLFGRGDLRALQELHRRSRWIGWALAAAASLAVYLVAPVVLEVWSRGEVDYRPALMLVAMTYAATAGGWHVSRVLLLSTNEHFALAWPFLSASLLALPLAWVLIQSFGLVGLMSAMLVLEVVMWAWCAHLARRLLGTRGPDKALGALT